ncbi:DEKNAAC103543, partial [Brettanomyces naardenensis]
MSLVAIKNAIQSSLHITPIDTGERTQLLQDPEIQPYDDQQSNPDKDDSSESSSLYFLSKVDPRV